MNVATFTLVSEDKFTIVQLILLGMSPTSSSQLDGLDNLIFCDFISLSLSIVKIETSLKPDLRFYFVRQRAAYIASSSMYVKLSSKTLTRARKNIKDL